jgi:DUF1009 family protein
MKKIGLLAGKGDFPVIFARAAKQSGLSVVALGMPGAYEPALPKETEVFKEGNFGAMAAVIKYFLDNKCNEIVMAGKADKSILFDPAKLDETAKKIISKLKDKQDNSILVAMAAEFALNGIAVRSPLDFIGPVLAVKGLMSKRPPDAREQADIDFGWPALKATGKLDIGQAMIVKDRMVIAVEALEGPDQAILRAGTLAGPGTVVLKMSKPGQDLRMDLPVIGKDTIDAMSHAGATCIAVEAGRTIILDKDRVLKEADQKNIAVIGI